MIESQLLLRHREPQSGVAIQSHTQRPMRMVLDCHASLAMTNEGLCFNVKQTR